MVIKHKKQTFTSEVRVSLGDLFRRPLATSQRKLLGITHLFPHNELVHLPYIAVATNTRADKKVKCSFL